MGRLSHYGWRSYKDLYINTLGCYLFFFVVVVLFGFCCCCLFFAKLMKMRSGAVMLF